MGTRARAASRQTAGGIPRSMRTMPRSRRRRAIPHGITTRSLRRSMMIDASRTRRALRTRLLSKAMPMRMRSQRWARLRLTRTMTTTHETRRARLLLPPTAARMGIGGRPTLPSSTSGRIACCTASRTRRGAILAPSLRLFRAHRLRRRNAKPAHASRATITTIWRICFLRTRRCRTTTFTTSRRYVVGSTQGGYGPNSAMPATCAGAGLRDGRDDYRRRPSNDEYGAPYNEASPVGCCHRSAAAQGTGYDDLPRGRQPEADGDMPWLAALPDGGSEDPSEARQRPRQAREYDEHSAGGSGGYGSYGSGYDGGASREEDYATHREEYGDYAPEPAPRAAGAASGAQQHAAWRSYHHEREEEPTETAPQQPQGTIGMTTRRRRRRSRGRREGEPAASE